jgi:hypothetical protein
MWALYRISVNLQLGLFGIKVFVYFYGLNESDFVEQ